MNNTKISVIVPVFNSENTLETCLKSIIAQSLREIEIICINDGSHDNSLEVLHKITKKDKRVKIVNKIKEGYGTALNTGLNLAEGEYEAIIEPRDFVDKKMLEKLYERAKTSEADIVKSSYFKVYKSNNAIKPVNSSWDKKCPIPSWYFRINECPAFFSFNPSIWSCIYKKTFLNNNSIRFVQAPEKSFVDNPFQVETMLLAQKIVYTSTPYYYRSYDKNLNLNAQNLFAPFERCEEMLEILNMQKIKDKNLYANIYKRIFWHIQNVLSTLSRNLQNKILEKIDIKNIPYEIQLRIESLISKLDNSLIINNSFVNNSERKLFNSLLKIKAKSTF